jgi:hypothetical protein
VGVAHQDPELLGVPLGQAVFPGVRAQDLPVDGGVKWPRSQVGSSPAASWMWRPPASAPLRTPWRRSRWGRER